MYTIFLLVLALTTLGMAGCTGKGNNVGTETEKQKAAQEPEPTQEPEPIDGGVTNKTDYNAPKEIGSKDITGLYATFCPDGEWSVGNRNKFYTFEIKTDDAGIVKAYEQLTGISAVADAALTDSVQNVIDTYDLVSKNGVYRLTAGLDPSMFGPCKVEVTYASGEELKFTINNEPDAEWAVKMYLAFAKWFAAQGNYTLLPPEFDKMVSDFRIRFNDKNGGKTYSYGIEPERDKYGRQVLYRVINDEKEQVPIFDTMIFYNGISSIVSEYDLQAYDVSSSLYGYEETEDDKKDPEAADLQLVIGYENGRTITAASSAQSTVDDLISLLMDLFGYFDDMF